MQRARESIDAERHDAERGSLSVFLPISEKISAY
jgi:hypothetical protein